MMFYFFLLLEILWVSQPEILGKFGNFFLILQSIIFQKGDFELTGRTIKLVITLYISDWPIEEKILCLTNIFLTDEAFANFPIRK